MMEEESPQLNLFEFDEGVTGVFQIFPAEAAEGPLRDWVEVGLKFVTSFFIIC